MSDINICRKHGKTIKQARKAAEHLASELQADLEMTYSWEGDVLNFQRPGVKGQLTMDDQEVAIQIKLGLLFSAFKPMIEKEVHKFFDENFPA
ncbi:MAG: polyhydroxyalkanoic acid system family protein [Rhodocyclaceae bacterium]